jgi:hypothetical protein
LFESLNEDEIKNCENNFDEIEGDLNKLLLKLKEMKDTEPIEIRKTYKDILLNSKQNGSRRINDNFHSIQVYSDEFVDIPKVAQNGHIFSKQESEDEIEIKNSQHTLAGFIEVTLQKQEKLLPLLAQPVEDICVLRNENEIVDLAEGQAEENSLDKHFPSLKSEETKVENSLVKSFPIQKLDFDCQCNIENEDAKIKLNEIANENERLLSQLEAKNEEISTLVEDYETKLKDIRDAQITFDREEEEKNELIRANQQLYTQLELKNADISKLMASLEKVALEKSEFEINSKLERQEINKICDDLLSTNENLSIQMDAKIEEIANLMKIVETKFNQEKRHVECQCSIIESDEIKNLSLQLEVNLDEIKNLKEKEVKYLEEIDELKLELSRQNEDIVVSPKLTSPSKIDRDEEINYDCHEINSLEDLISNYLKLIKSYKKILAQLDEVNTDHSQLKVSYNRLNTRYLKLRESTSESETSSTEINKKVHNNSNNFMESKIAVAHLKAPKDDASDEAGLNNMKVAYEHLHVLYNRQKANFFSEYNKLHDEYLNSTKTSNKSSSKNNV